MTTKRVTILAMVFLTLALAIFACPISVECPIHDGVQCYFTRTKTVDGVLVGVYHCYRGHDVLARCN